MLTALSIANIVLIERLDLDFAAGLGVLTGETGAGKSILLDALGLALGARADSALVRQGTDKAQVTASFAPPAPGTPLAVLLADNEIALEPGEPLLIRRSLKADGGSRAFLNDQPCSAALLREVGGHLVEIHGQHDDRGLLAPAGHRALLDAYARADTGAVAAAHAAWRAAEDRLAAAKAAISEAERDREWLGHCVAELAALSPQPGEEAELAEARAAMQKGERIAGDLGTILEAFEGSDSGPALLRGAARRLDRLAGDHPLLAEALASLDRAIIDADEAETKLREAARALEYDPDRLEATETRLFELRAMARKHGVQPDELPTLAGDLAARLDAIEGGRAGLAKLEAAVAESAAAYTH
ncbi:MAG TPA: AAA family ATPase, partial [Sphingopyxis sp.]|nr:AAA family ATPase [Sphingopyxis sp.]